MDPNANLREQEEILTEIDNLPTNRHRKGERRLRPRLIELRQALIRWLSDGGFEPDWTKAPKASIYFAPYRGRLE